MCYAETGQPDEAEKAFRRALQFAPNNPLILGNYATLLRKMDRLEEALQVLRSAVGEIPNSAPAWTELGMAALKAGRAAEARTALERATQLQPGSALAWHALGNACRESGDIQAAEAAFRKAVSAAPGYGSAWANLGIVLRLLGRSAESPDCFEQARSAGYTGPELADALVGALVDTGRLPEALEHAWQLVREHPGFAPGQVTLAHLLWEYGPALSPGDDPLATFRSTAEGDLHNIPLHLAFARFLLAARQGEEALQRIRILRANADHPTLAWLEADALELLGHSEPAGALYAQAYRVSGNASPAFLNAYVRHLLKAGKWDAAARHATEATQLDPGNQEAWCYLGTAWRLLEDAREFWLFDYERLVTMAEVEPPPGFAGMTEFLTMLMATLEPMHQARREPVQQSLRGGSQTPGRLFGRRNPAILATQVALLRAIERWLATLPADAGHPFLAQKSRSVRFSGSWSAKLWSSGFHSNHIHPEGWLSSAFYVHLPPSVRSQAADNNHAGYIHFGQPMAELGLDLPARRILRPEPGRLALFPSYMWHGTVPFSDKEPRITIAFDMMPGV